MNSPNTIVILQGAVDLHRQKLRIILNYIVLKFNGGDNLLMRGMVRGLQMFLDTMSPQDVEDIYNKVKRTVIRTCPRCGKEIW